MGNGMDGGLVGCGLVGRIASSQPKQGTYVLENGVDIGVKALVRDAGAQRVAHLGCKVLALWFV